ncbi:hypothetical protein QOT17_008492 [Balamuthia mandrillaris]
MRRFIEDKANVEKARRLLRRERASISFSVRSGLGGVESGTTLSLFPDFSPQKTDRTDESNVCCPMLVVANDEFKPYQLENYYSKQEQSKNREFSFLKDFARHCVFGFLMLYRKPRRWHPRVQ